MEALAAYRILLLWTFPNLTIMAKDTFYFSHDYNARNDPKILELRSEYGMEGVGIYWCLIETLAEQENGYIIASLMGGLSVGFSIPKGMLIGIVDFMVKIDLLCKDEIGFYSRRMMEHKRLRKTLSDKGKEGAEKRWKNSPPISPPNAKERKEKKIINDIPIWKKDFSAYQKECSEEFTRLSTDKIFLEKLKTYNPDVNILKSLQKLYDDYWNTEEGWINKKKSKVNKINWATTISNTIKFHKVYLTKQEQLDLR